MDKDRNNPFTESSRLSLVANNSLLFYGDNDYSLFKRLKQNKRLYSSQVVSQKEAEEKILWRYEKEFYSVDQFGHSLAQQAFDGKLEAYNREKEDFWQKIVPSFNRKIKKNPFTNSEATSTSSITTHISTDSSMRSSRNIKQSTISSQQTSRVQITKLRKTINDYKKADQMLSKEQKEQKFSIIHLYKKKKAQESIHAAYNLSSIQIKPEKQEKPKFQYPQTIFVKEQQYFFVPLG